MMVRWSARLGKLFASLAILVTLVALDLAIQPVSGPAHAKTPRAAVDRAGKDQKAKYAKLGPVMAEIGKEATALAGGKSDGIFLYVTIVDGHPSPLLFRDLGKSVRVYRDSQSLQALIEKAWVLENNDPRKSWAIMIYEVRGTTFDVQYVYPDELDPKSDFGERLTSAWPARFAGKRLTMDRALKAYLRERGTAARRREKAVPLCSQSPIAPPPGDCHITQHGDPDPHDSRRA